MTSKLKYLSIILLGATAALCMAGASAWIISTTPRSFQAGQSGTMRLAVSGELNYDLGQTPTLTSDILGTENIAALKEDLTLTFTSEGENFTGVTADDYFITLSSDSVLSDGAKVYPKGAQLAGNTYRTYLGVNLTNPDYVFFANGVETSALNIPVILRYRTVQVGEEWYTVEEALNVGGKAIVKADSAFTNLSAEVSGYSSQSFYTVKSGSTLLLPYSAEDENGNNGEYKGDEGTTTSSKTGIEPPANYNKAAQAFCTLTIPAITLKNEGEIIIGGFTGAKNGEPEGAISGGWSKIEMDGGTIVSTGEVKVYGSVTGSGTINALGGKVGERFEINDWPGGKSAGGRFMGEGASVGVLGIVLGTTPEISADSPNQFPFEDYSLNAISGPTLVIQSSAEYVGLVCIWTGSVSQSGYTISSMLSMVELRFVGSASGNGSNAIIGLRPGGVFTKTVSGGREKITVSGGAAGGIATLSMDVLASSIKMDTAKIMFPVSKQIDLTLTRGDYYTQYGYEFMSGCGLSLQNGATLTFAPGPKGSIIYGDSSLKVGNGCNVTIQSAFGGEVQGEQGATLNVDTESVQNTSYIGGKGSMATGSGFDTLTMYFHFEGTPTTLPVSGKTINSQNGSLSAHTQYSHNGSYWACQERFTVNYNPLGGQLGGQLSEVLTAYTGEQIEVNSVNTPPPVRKFYQFTGWYFDDGCTQPVSDGKTFIAGVDHNVTVYAGWQRINYSVYGRVEDEEGKTELKSLGTWQQGGTLALSKPQKDGSVFQGWYFGEDLSGETAEELNDSTASQVISLQSQGASGTITLYGKYEKLQNYTVTFTCQRPTAFESGEDNSSNYAQDVQDYTVQNITNGVTVESVMPQFNLASNDYDVTREYYFDGWFGEDGGRITGSELIGANLDEDGDGTITITAKWARKVTLIVTVKASGSAGGLFGIGSYTRTSSCTISFGQFGDDPGGELSVTSGRNSTVVTNSRKRYLSKGQTYTVTATQGSIEGAQGNAYTATAGDADREVVVSNS